ncbi:hypothetical protein FSC37_04400 [Piscinibacter aquaticus]|uniref:Uncharacterized protein n=1 Tax=Piscinibacter aquaticus TaxID=392597 RepID=A0A5C6U1M1_9BURK|nr:hypothetical protein FSC37_04400 [Piscinibacter aquaticus]
MRHLLLALITTSLTGAALAKLPPLSDEAKAKAAEAAAKTAHAGKVDNYKLCLSMDKVAAHYMAEAKKAGRPVNKPTETPACVDPGPYVPAATAAPAATAPAAATPAAAAPAKKS